MQMNQEYGLLVIAVKLKWVAWDRSTNYGHPMKPFFWDIPTFWANWADRANKFWGIFGRNISPHLSTVSPVSMISIIQLFLPQKNKKNFAFQT